MFISFTQCPIDRVSSFVTNTTSLTTLPQQIHTHTHTHTLKHKQSWIAFICTPTQRTSFAAIGPSSSAISSAAPKKPSTRRLLSRDRRRERVSASVSSANHTNHPNTGQIALCLVKCDAEEQAVNVQCKLQLRRLPDGSLLVDTVLVTGQFLFVCLFESSNSYFFNLICLLFSRKLSHFQVSRAPAEGVQTARLKASFLQFAFCCDALRGKIECTFY